MTKSDTTNTALRIALAYFDAMSKKDVDRLLSLAADNVTCTSPLGDLVGIQSFRGFSEGFAKMINRLRLIAAFGDDEHAVIVYEAETLPVNSAYTAEYLVVKNDKIVSTRVIYDGIPFMEYASKQQQH